MSVHEVDLAIVVGVVVGSVYDGRRRAAGESVWRPRRRAAFTALDVGVGYSVLVAACDVVFLPISLIGGGVCLRSKCFLVPASGCCTSISAASDEVAKTYSAAGRK